MTLGKGSKYREFYDLSGRITCMSADTAQTAIRGTVWSESTLFAIYSRSFEHILHDITFLFKFRGVCSKVTTRSKYFGLLRLFWGF